MTPLDHGFVQIYTGEGKGKTTAALGLTLRAVGHGLRVLLVQFMKDFPYGELDPLKALPGGLVEIRRYGNDSFVLEKRPPNSEERDTILRGLEETRMALEEGQHDLVIMDEICPCVYFGLLGEEALMPLLEARPERVELVLTGRYCPESWLDHADLVSEMREVKHYYRQGVLARPGIES